MKKIIGIFICITLLYLIMIKTLQYKKQRMDLTVFDKIFKNNTWGSKESKSGPGSTINNTKNIRKEIPKLMNDYKLKTLFDCPCGDVNWISHIFIKVNFIWGGILINFI